MAVAVFTLLSTTGGVLAQEGRPDPATRLETLESSIKDGDINAILEAANFAKNNGLPDDASRLFNQVLGLDAFNAKAHAGLGHRKFMDCWCDQSEIDDFKATLDEEKKDVTLKMLRKEVFADNTYVARDALKKFDASSRAWSVDTAYNLLEKVDDEWIEEIAIGIFSRWAGDRARDLWIKRCRRGGFTRCTIKMIEALQPNVTGELSNPATKYLVDEVTGQRNENVSLKCLEVLAGVKTDEITQVLRKFLNRCDNQNVKQKLLAIL
ncbi:MAG: hypothetical protein AB7F75_03380 [Planctomycetota bacterium]